MSAHRTPDPDPDDDDRRRRADLKDRLWGEGVADDRAEEWIGRWEREAAARGLPRDAEFWRLAGEWIDRERGAD